MGAAASVTAFRRAAAWVLAASAACCCSAAALASSSAWDFLSAPAACACVGQLLGQSGLRSGPGLGLFLCLFGQLHGREIVAVLGRLTAVKRDHVLAWLGLERGQIEHGWGGGGVQRNVDRRGGFKTIAERSQLQRTGRFPPPFQAQGDAQLFADLGLEDLVFGRRDTQRRVLRPAHTHRHVGEQPRSGNFHRQVWHRPNHRRQGAGTRDRRRSDLGPAEHPRDRQRTGTFSAAVISITPRLFPSGILRPVAVTPSGNSSIASSIGPLKPSRRIATISKAIVVPPRRAIGSDRAARSAFRVSVCQAQPTRAKSGAAFRTISLYTLAGSLRVPPNRSRTARR